MDDRRLRQVIAIQQHGSLRRAAQALGVTQPTLSKSLARLEDELGVILFDRTGAGAQATPIGLYIAERAGRMVGDSDRLRREVALLASGDAGEVQVGLGPALRATFMPRFAEAVALGHRRLRLRLMSERRPYLVEALQAGIMDVIVVTAAPDLDDLDVVQVEVMRDRLIAVAAPSHPLAGRAGISPSEFAAHVSISQPPDTAFATSTLMSLDGEAAARATFFVINDFPTIRRLVGRGLATTIGFEHQLRAAIETGELVQLDLAWAGEVRIVAAMTRAAAHSPILRRIADKARVVGQGLVEASPATTPH